MLFRTRSLFKTRVGTEEKWVGYENAIYRKLTCDNTSQTAAQVVTGSAHSLHRLTFLIDDTFLMIIHWKVLASSINVFPCLNIFSFFFFSFSLCCFRCEYCFDSKQHRLHPRPPCLISIPFWYQDTFIDLFFVFKQLASLCRWNLNKLKLVASHRKRSRKLTVKRGTCRS